MKPFEVKILQTGLLFVFVFSPVFFGSVHDWASMSFAAILFSFLLIFPDTLLEVIKLPRYFALISGAACLYLLVQSFKISANPSETAVELLKWLACGVFFLLVQRLPSASQRFFFKAAVLVVLFEACYGLIQTKLDYAWVLWREQGKHAGFATGTFLNRNHLAGLLEIGIGISMGYILKNLYSLNRKMLFLSFLSFVLVFTALVQTGSRMGLFSFFLAALSGCIFLSFRPRLLAIFLFMFFAAGMFSYYCGQVEWTVRLKGLQEFWGGRPLVWEDTLRMIKAHFWFGSGLGAYAWVFPQFQSASSLMGWNHAHQDYLELAAGLGVPFFLLWSAGFLFFIFRIFCRNLQSRESEDFTVIWGMGCGLLAFLIHGFADFNWAMTSHTFWFFCLLSSAYGLLIHNQKKHYEMKPFLRTMIRVLSFILVLLAGQKAWAGVFSYAAERASLRNDFSLAANRSEKALRIDPGSPSLQFLHGKNLYEKSRRKQDLILADQSANIFERLTQKHPEYARAWIYRGLLSKDHEAGKFFFREGLKREPSSAWILYITSARLLSGSGNLTVKEKEDALGNLKLSLNHHYPNQASPYLMSALKILWRNSREFKDLVLITPKDYFSYKILMKFIEEKNLWGYSEQVTEDFFKLREQQYSACCVKARQLLAGNEFRESFNLFQKCYWVRPEISEARIGMLIAGTGPARLLYDPKQGERWLEEMLGDDSLVLPAQELELLGPAVNKLRNPFIYGLWAYRSGKWQESLQSFENEAETQIKTRRWRAQSYEKIGRTAEAVEILRPVLKEKTPDLRELILLKRLDSDNQKIIESKMQFIQAGYANYTLSPLKDGKSSIWINLMPGQAQLKVVMKSVSEKNVFAYVRLGLWEGRKFTEIGKAYVSSSDWKLYSFNFSTSGGGRLLSVEQVNKGPQLELGPLKLSVEK